MSTLRDVRRTYQRAFKAVLLAHRLGLSAEMFAEYGQSELGYLLDHGDELGGLAFYDDGGWQPHRVNFDPNLLPLLDTFHAPDPAHDDRGTPALVRRQALFDLWERLFDHTWLREQSRSAPDDPVWLLYDEAAENQPDNPAQVLRHLGVDLTHADLVLEFDPAYGVTADDLTDERWPTRVWHADALVRSMVGAFRFADIRDARPASWAADDLGGSGDGNENLATVVRRGLVGSGGPVRFADLTHLDDCLREHARDALVAYLCRLDRVPLPWPGAGSATGAGDLTDLLLIDVEAAPATLTTRIDQAIASVTTYVARARLGLEAPWRPASAFTALWDKRYATCDGWARWRRAQLYPESTIAARTRARDRRSEAYAFLEDELRRASLTVPVPGGLEYWEASGPPRHPGLVLLQERETSRLRQLSPAREGLGLLGTPDAGGQRSWLAPQQVAAHPSGDGDGDDNGDDNDTDNGEPVVVRARIQAPTTPAGVSPLWIEAAVRLGTRFLRVPAAGPPPAAQPFRPRPDGDCGCGCSEGHQARHPAVVDEYYFWLIDSRWYDDIEQVADWPGWHEEGQAAGLLVWPSKPMVHLMWSRVRDGEIEQPRRSVDGVRIRDGANPSSVDLTLTGRVADSLLFEVTGGEGDPGASADPLPGFRYDLVPDQAVVVPVVLPPTDEEEDDNGDGDGDGDGDETPVEPTAYPYFGYAEPGAPLFPLDPFSEAVTVAENLRARCTFESALRWLSVVHDPVTTDNRWCGPRGNDGDGDGGDGNGDGDGDGDGDNGDGPAPVARLRGRRRRVALELAHPALASRGRSWCCDGSGVDEPTARRRYVTLTYLETLLAWADCERLRHTAPGDALARALDAEAARLLGPMPVTHVERGPGHDGEGEGEEEGEDQAIVATFEPTSIELSGWLMSLYERVADRRCRSQHDPGAGSDCCCGCGGGCDGDCCCPASPYRFTYVLARAHELSAQVGALGSALQTAYEKGDSEHLAGVRSLHEHQVLNLTRGVRQDQWRDADWQVQSLKLTKQVAQNNRDFYQKLVNNGLNAGEMDFQDLTNSGTASTTAATVSEAIGTVMGVIPDVFVGTTAFAHCRSAPSSPRCSKASAASTSRCRRSWAATPACAPRRAAGTGAWSSGTTRSRSSTWRSRPPSGRSWARNGGAARRCAR